jgi:hypothetical protein
MLPRSVISLVVGLSLALALVWGFPRVWYAQGKMDRQGYWLREASEVEGWEYRAVSVAESAEKVLVADRLICGEFSSPGSQPVRVFSAKRFSEKPHDIGLFVHTPDRCWTESGWRIEPVDPDLREIQLHGRNLLLERRLFVVGTQRELVYFGGLVGGEPLPYRLDHNLSVGMKHAMRQSGDRTGTALRAQDKRLWTRVWESFLSRRALMGPKQFIRISTPIREDDTGAADELLVDFLGKWLAPADYAEELATWQASVLRR